MAAHAKGAATAIRRHVAQCGTKGNRKPPSKRVTSERSAEQRVGGAVGMTFDNQSVGK
jgi:hypothetical protein